MSGLQRWVARQLVGRQIVTRLAPLIGDERGERPAEAAGLAVQLLQAGARGGFARDAAAQVNRAQDLPLSTTSSLQNPIACITERLPPAEQHAVRAWQIQLSPYRNMHAAAGCGRHGEPGAGAVGLHHAAAAQHGGALSIMKEQIENMLPSNLVDCCVFVTHLLPSTVHQCLAAAAAAWQRAPR